MTSRGYAQSGWDYDNRGMRKARGEEIRGIYLCSDETGDFDPYLSRRFVPGSKPAKPAFSTASACVTAKIFIYAF